MVGSNRALKGLTRTVQKKLNNTIESNAGNHSVQSARELLVGVYGLSVGLRACLEDEGFVFQLRGLPIVGNAAGASPRGCWGPPRGCWGLLEGCLMHHTHALDLHNTQSTGWLQLSHWSCGNDL